MRETHLTGIEIRNFTAFSELSLEFCPGINVFIGANGTGKSHLLKLLNGACETSRHRDFPFAGAILSNFMPYRSSQIRLVRRGTSGAYVCVKRSHAELNLDIPTGPPNDHDFSASWAPGSWYARVLRSAYIPVKEMLANAPGFRSLHKERELHFEQVYADIIDKAYLPPLKKLPAEFRALAEKLESAIRGPVRTEGEHFFLGAGDRGLEFSLVAEGFRKLALLSLLIRNGSIAEGSILFWDEPEANLNPRLLGLVIEVLLELQRLGVQIFFATHSYFVLAETDLQSRSEDSVRYFSLYHDEESGAVKCSVTEDFDLIEPNQILDTMTSLYDRDVERALGSPKK